MNRIKISLAIVLCLALLIPAIALRTKRSGGFPVVVAVNPTAAHANDVLTVTVYLNETTDVDQPVSLWANNSSMLTNLPASQTVPAGSDHVTFYTTVSSTAYGSLSITAAANSHQASSAAPIID